MSAIYIYIPGVVSYTVHIVTCFVGRW